MIPGRLACRHSPAAVDARPGRMSGAGAGGKPLRRFFRTGLHAAMAAHGAFAVVAGERFFRLDIVLPIAGVGSHATNLSSAVMGRWSDERMHPSGSVAADENWSLRWHGLNRSGNK